MRPSSLNRLSSDAVPECARRQRPHERPPVVRRTVRVADGIDTRRGRLRYGFDHVVRELMAVQRFLRLAQSLEAAVSGDHGEVCVARRVVALVVKESDTRQRETAALTGEL